MRLGSGMSIELAVLLAVTSMVVLVLVPGLELMAA